jgi:hypothetical protein
MQNTSPEAGQPENDAYQRAARFDGRWAEQDAEQAYQRSRKDLHRSQLETDLSVFRLQIGNRIGDIAYLGWYVALIGKPPDETLEARLERHLARGTPVELPEAVTTMLQERRAKDAGLAPWVERRYGKLTKAELYQRPEEEKEKGNHR